MRHFAYAILAGALLAFSGRTFAQTNDFSATLKTAADKQRGQKYFQAFDLYLKAWKQASTPDDKQRVNDALAAWVREQKRFYANNAETVAMLEKNLDSLEGPALFEAGSVIAWAYENKGDLQQAWEWHDKRLGIRGIPDEKLAVVRTHMRELRQMIDQYAEAAKRYEPVIADLSSSKSKKDEAQMRLILALAADRSKRNVYFKAAADFLADETVASDWKLGVFEGLKNVYTQDRDWDNAALCLRQYADFPGLAPSNKARILFMLGDVNWRQRHKLQEAVPVFREICAIPEVPAKAKQDAETWIRMLTERF